MSEVADKLKMAINLHRSGSLQSAKKLYSDVLNIDLHQPDANHNLGVLLSTEGKFERALSLFETAFLVNPNFPQFRISYIHALIRTGKLVRAKHLIGNAPDEHLNRKTVEEIEYAILAIDETALGNRDDVATYLEMWRKHNQRAGNVHLSVNEAELKKLPFRSTRAWLRPTVSDSARVSEYLNGLYFHESYLHEYTKSIGPTTLIDVGANIGLSSLSLIQEFSTIRNVYAIEAEPKNYSVLDANFALWGTDMPSLQWTAINGVASHSADAKLVRTAGLNELKNGHSASGTFKYQLAGGDEIDNQAGQSSFSVNDLISELPKDEKIIVKVDIEGGEEHLFKSNTTWLRKCLYFTCEIHDVFHHSMINSSRNMIKALSEFDFAIVPARDTLYCYNRGLIDSHNLNS